MEEGRSNLELGGGRGKRVNLWGRKGRGEVGKEGKRENVATRGVKHLGLEGWALGSMEKL